MKIDVSNDQNKKISFRLCDNKLKFYDCLTCQQFSSKKYNDMD